MKKRLVKAIALMGMMGTLLLAGCSFNQKNLSLYADDASSMAQEASKVAQAAKGSEGQQGEESSEVIVPQQTPMDPNEALEWAKKTRDAQKAVQEKEEQESSEQGNGESQTTDTATQTPAPVETAAPAESAKPAETPKPAETTKPVETAKPVATEKPAESTPAPVATPKPVENTPAPVATSEPVATPTPVENTPAPVVTPAPVQVDPCANGHDLDAGYVWSEPSCTEPGDLCRTCKRCGITVHTSISKTDHDMELVKTWPGDCITPAHYQYKCKNCIHTEDVYDDSCVGRDHEWYTGEVKYFDEEALEWKTRPRTFCTICNMDKPD